MNETDPRGMTRNELLAGLVETRRTRERLDFAIVRVMLELYRRGEPVPDYSRPPDRRGRRRMITARS
jgi:hypothetical protein